MIVAIAGETMTDIVVVEVVPQHQQLSIQINLRIFYGEWKNVNENEVNVTVSVILRCFTSRVVTVQLVVMVVKIRMVLLMVVVLARLVRFPMMS